MRKRRTRQHQIEDLSFNFVEKQILEAFCILRDYARQEYSYDASVRTFDEKGNIENGEFFIQIKATDHLKYSRKHKGYELVLNRRDMDLWLNELSPVLVVLYDAKKSRGYFLDIQVYFEQNRELLKDIRNSKLVFIQTRSKFTPAVIEQYKNIKNEREKTIKGL